MKIRTLLLSCSAAVLATLAFWNGQATAQSSSGPEGRALSDLPLGSQCIVTLDARSNSRAAMTPEMQANSGFSSPNTAKGEMLHHTPEWLVLKHLDAEYWIPRDKILMVKVQR